MKKQLTMLLVLALFSFLTACGGGGGGSTPSQTSTNDPPATETPTTPPVVTPPVVTPPVVTPTGNASLLTFDATGNSYSIIRANGTISVAKTGTDSQEKWRKEVLVGEKFVVNKILARGSKVFLAAVYTDNASVPNFGNIWQVTLDSAGNIETKREVRQSQYLHGVTYEAGDNFVTMLLEVGGSFGYQYLQRINLDGSSSLITYLLDPAWGYQLRALESANGLIYVAGYQASSLQYAEKTLVVGMIDKDLSHFQAEPQRSLSPVNLGYPREDEFLGWTTASGKFVISGRLQQPDGTFESHLFEVSLSDGSWSNKLLVPNSVKIGPLTTDDSGNIYGIQTNAGSQDLVKIATNNQITKLATFTDQVSDITYNSGVIYVTFANAQPTMFDLASGIRYN